MGNAMAKEAVVRKAPRRYVAKKIPRTKAEVDGEFSKVKHTLQGLNKMEEQQYEPRTQVGTAENTKLANMTGANQGPDQWYLNTWLEMMDNKREERLITNGTFPLEWDRDKHEPYTLVQNRIDKEDLDWLLSEDARKMPIDELVKQTKLEQQAIEDILATIELPRKQYRNYQGKLHKTIDDPNQWMVERKKEMEKSREVELLRRIGYSEEELDDEKQYLTDRSRGIKTLDELGVSLREKKRSERAALHSDMDTMLEMKRDKQVEEGKFEPSESDTQDMKAIAFDGAAPRAFRSPRLHKYMRQLDSGWAKHRQERMEQLVAVKRETPLGPTHYGTPRPIYHPLLSKSEKEMRKMSKEAMDRTRNLQQNSGVSSAYRKPLKDDGSLRSENEQNDELFDESTNLIRSMKAKGRGEWMKGGEMKFTGDVDMETRKKQEMDAIRRGDHSLWHGAELLDNQQDGSTAAPTGKTPKKPSDGDEDGGKKRE